MSAGEAPYYLRKLCTRYLLVRGTEALLIAMAIGLIILGATRWLQLSPWIAVVGFLVCLVITLVGMKLPGMSTVNIIAYLNTNYPSLQASVDLLTCNAEDLTLLEKIQQQRTLREFEKLYPNMQLPHRMGRAAILFFVAVGCAAVLMSLTPIAKNQPGLSRGDAASQNSLTKAEVPGSIKTFSIAVQPPAYTQLKKFAVNNFHLRVPEGSLVTWRIEFTQGVENPSLVFSGKDSLKIDGEKKSTAPRKFASSSLYHISWKNRGQAVTSDYYKIEVVADASPEIAFMELRQSTELSVGDNLQIPVKASISDDYNLTDAYIIATVAKGSGESVKFREEKLLFANPENIVGKKVNASRIIDIKKLGLEPGDELYFYAEGIDNQQPVPNKSRTETYFISLRDTASQETVADAGLGVDLMPEYFRSQRQIIIDTEKLLAKRKKMKKADFNFTSNELGYDQKVLRLKYGEFLGEEFESELAHSEDVVEEQVAEIRPEGEEENIAEKFGHAHDKDNEHNLVEDKKANSKTHQHDETKDPEEKEDPLKGFVHEHDDAEEATFFLQSVRTKLKAALTEMWDAELYLRLYQPEKSLPYQYKALKLLKEVSNDARIYVHKTGVDPPPIKEEKRLSGDLADIKDSRREASEVDIAKYPNVRLAIAWIENAIDSKPHELSKDENAVLKNAGQEIAQLALERPVEFLPALTIIKNITDKIDSSAWVENLNHLEMVFWKVLPAEEVNGKSNTRSIHQLDESFIKNLENLKND